MIDTIEDAEFVSELLIILEKIADALEIISTSACEDCERITKDEAYQYVCEKPPDKGL